MGNQLEFVPLEDRMDSLIEETKLREESKAKAKKQQDRVMILQEKDIVKTLISQKETVTKKMKNFFKLGVGAGVAALGLAAVAVGYSLVKANKNFKLSQSIENDVKIAKRNVNTMLATLQGGKAGIYQITQRISHCRKALNLQDMNPQLRTLPKYT